MKTYLELTTNEIKLGFKAFCSNKKQVDTSALNYFIGMIIGHRWYDKKRNESIVELFTLIETDSNLYKTIQSDYTRNKIAEYYNKSINN